MPNKKASIKHLRQTVKRTAHNSSIIKKIKDLIKKGDKAIAAGKIKEQYPDLAKNLQKAVDKAVKAGIIKANAGNRKKSRFAARAKKAMHKKEEANK